MDAPEPSQPAGPSSQRQFNETAGRMTPTEEQHSPGIDLARVVWLLTTLAFLIAMLVLGLRGDMGYAGVTLAVALAAAINLF